MRTGGIWLTCDLCGAKAQGEIAATKDGWDWFTQHRASTFHACGVCVIQRTSEIAEVRRLAAISTLEAPEDSYPTISDEYAQSADK